MKKNAHKTQITLTYRMDPQHTHNSIRPYIHNKHQYSSVNKLALINIQLEIYKRG